MQLVHFIWGAHHGLQPTRLGSGESLANCPLLVKYLVQRFAKATLLQVESLQIWQQSKLRTCPTQERRELHNLTTTSIHLDPGDPSSVLPTHGALWREAVFFSVIEGCPDWARVWLRFRVCFTARVFFFMTAV